MYIQLLILSFTVKSLCSSTTELQLGLELTKCFTSRMAVWLTYLAAITNTKNHTYNYCKRKLETFRSSSVGRSLAEWSAHKLAGDGAPSLLPFRPNFTKAIRMEKLNEGHPTSLNPYTENVIVRRPVPPPHDPSHQGCLIRQTRHRGYLDRLLPRGQRNWGQNLEAWLIRSQEAHGKGLNLRILCYQNL